MCAAELGVHLPTVRARSVVFLDAQDRNQYLVLLLPSNLHARWLLGGFRNWLFGCTRHF